MPQPERRNPRFRGPAAVLTVVEAAAEAIRNLLGRYCELMDAGDFAGLAALFSSAELADEKGRVFARGRDEVLAQWVARTILYDGSPRTRHLVANPVITVDDSSGLASATSAYVVFQATDDLPLQAIISGRYADRFARDITGRWAFVQRRYAVDLVGNLSQHLRAS